MVYVIRCDSVVQNISQSAKLVQVVRVERGGGAELWGLLYAGCLYSTWHITWNTLNKLCFR